MQIGGEGIESIFMNMALEGKNFKRTQIWREIFLCLFIWEWAK
jgi:hypothetical protein